MRKKTVAVAILAAFVFAACGNQAGESDGNMAGGSVPADTEMLTESAPASDDAVASDTPESAESHAGSSARDEGITVAQEGSAGVLQVTLPEGWAYDACPEGSDQLRVGDYGIHFYPENVSEGFIELCHTDFFGVCGTGLEEERVTLAGDEAIIGTHDQGDNWDFVSFRGTNEGIVALTCGVEDWWPAYGEQALEILDTVCLKQGHAGETDNSGENFKEGSRIEELGLSLEVTECTDTGATLVFRQSGGSPTGELTFGSVYHIERYEDGEWVEAPLVIKGNYAFNMLAYNIPLGGDREFQVDWEWLYGKLGPGEYRIRKDVDDFRKSGDYDVYEMYAYFEI